ncbi:TPA: type II toxin-antitoxin system ParD family antitoxin [Escherichia coli]|nr:type II toxin-antitoxin system ParD family antitoxin [Escherichia coli]
MGELSAESDTQLFEHCFIDSGYLSKLLNPSQSEVIHESLRLLREKQAGSRLQALRDLLAEGLSNGEPVSWEKDAFLKKVKAGARASGKNR